MLSTHGLGPGQLPPSGGAARERWESLAALVGLAEDLAAAHPEAGARRLGRRARRARPRPSTRPTVEGVTLASLHAAKGLEWDAVFLVGLADGTMPIVHADDRRAVEEERRLLYVGVTRAREHLLLSWAAARSPGGRATASPPGSSTGSPPRACRCSGPAVGGSRGRDRAEVVRCCACGRRS